MVAAGNAGLHPGILQPYIPLMSARILLINTGIPGMDPPDPRILIKDHASTAYSSIVEGPGCTRPALSGINARRNS
jgi:hypothetical protein